MTTPTALPPAARALIALTRADWGLACGAVMAVRPRPAHRPAPEQPPLVQPSHWPYWPAYPGAAVGWR